MHTSEELVVPGGDEVTGPFWTGRMEVGVAVGVAVGVVVGVVMEVLVEVVMVDVVPAASGSFCTCPPESSL